MPETKSGRLPATRFGAAAKAAAGVVFEAAAVALGSGQSKVQQATPGMTRAAEKAAKGTIAKPARKKAVAKKKTAKKKAAKKKTAKKKTAKKKSTKKKRL